MKGIHHNCYKGINGARLGLWIFGLHIARGIVLAGLIFIEAFADNPTPFDNSKTQSANQSPSLKDEMTLEEFQEEQNAQDAQKMQFLNAIQNSFFVKNRNPQDNNLNIIYQAGATPKIRLRYAMSTTFIFDGDTIAYVSVGDSNFFEVLVPKKEGYDLSNILIIKPLLIGVDTNLTVIGKSGKIYTFYLFSTHFTNSRNPALSVFVSDNQTIGKIDIIPPEIKRAQKLQRIQELQAINKKLSQEDSHEREVPSFEQSKTPSKDSNNSDENKSVDYSSKEIDDGKFIRIGDESNHLFIDKSKIRKHYYQSPRKKRMWWSLWLYKKSYKQADDLQAIDIFDDGKYTYFKYDREKAISKFPYAYKVIDGYDNPINSRVVGNYLIAEDVNRKWTLRLGEEYVCAQKIPSQDELDEERLQKAQQIVIPQNAPKTNKSETKANL